MTLSFRLHQEEDLPELKRLWEENTDWGTITDEMWRRHVVEVPGGGASIVVATGPDTDGIVGQFAFIPSLVKIGGRECRAFRPAAPIVAKSLRFRSPNPLSHPVSGMYLYAVKSLRQRGDGLIYMVPDPRWVRFFKMFPNLQAGTFPLWRIDLPLSKELVLPDGYEVTAATQLTGEQIDRLATTWSTFHSCSVVRDSRSLPWKIGNGDYEILQVERAGELVGLVASRRKGDRQWLICDVMAADLSDSLRATLTAVVNLAAERARAADAEKPINKASVLGTNAMEPVLLELGFARDNYKFPMVIHILDLTISKEDVESSKWYVSAND
jgi:hypothetical protein